MLLGQRLPLHLGRYNGAWVAAAHFPDDRRELRVDVAAGGPPLDCLVVRGEATHLIDERENRPFGSWCPLLKRVSRIDIECRERPTLLVESLQLFIIRTVVLLFGLVVRDAQSWWRSAILGSFYPRE